MQVNQGICLCSKQSLPTADDFIKCWAHECQRVFQEPFKSLLLLIFSLFVLNILIKTVRIPMIHMNGMIMFHIVEFGASRGPFWCSSGLLGGSWEDRLASEEDHAARSRAFFFGERPRPGLRSC